MSRVNFHIPIAYPDGYQNFPKALEYRFEEYHAYLRNINCCSDTVHRAQEFSEKIVDSVNKYYEGRVYDAYAIFSDALKNNVIETKYEFIDEMSRGQLYRARIEEQNQEKEFSKDDLFHIKFENRTKVRNQRFSISGLPCLYMSKSLFACWVEMERPSIDIFTAALIDITKEVLSFDLCKMYDILTCGNFEAQNKYAHFIHLVIATSFTVKDKSGEFKPEYIIPQFIMQWLLDNEYGISGIKYYCTSRTPDKDNGRLFINYAFPTKKIADAGFCTNLEEKFSINRVISGKHVQYYNKSANLIVPDLPSASQESVEISIGLKRNYRFSMFGVFENILTADARSIDDGDVCLSVVDGPQLHRLVQHRPPCKTVP